MLAFSFFYCYNECAGILNRSVGKIRQDNSKQGKRR